MTDDWMRLVVAVLAGFALNAALGFTLHVLRNRDTQKFAQIAEEKAKPQARLTVFQKVVWPTDDLGELYILVPPAMENIRTLCPIYIGISNVGSVPLKDCVLMVSTSKGISFVIKDKVMKQKLDPDIPGMAAYRRSESLQGMDQVSYELPTIPPKVAVGIHDSYFLEPSIHVPHIINAKSMEGFPVTVKTRFSFLYRITLFLHSPNAEPIVKTIWFPCLMASSEHEASNLILQRIREVRKKIEEKGGVLSKVRRLFVPKVWRTFNFAHYQEVSPLEHRKNVTLRIARSEKNGDVLLSTFRIRERKDVLAALGPGPFPEHAGDYRAQVAAR